MKRGYLKQKSTGFRSVERKKPTQQGKWNIHWHHAPLAKRHTTAPKVTELMKSASKEIDSGQKKKKIIISHNSFFHSSNSYINLCRLLESVRLTWFLCWHVQKASQWDAEPGTASCRNLALNARGTWWEVDACKCARGEERRYTWHGSWERLFVSTRCSLLLFKSEDEQVLRGTGWVLEQIRANIKGRTRRARATTDTQCSSEYSLFLRYAFSRAVLYVWFCFLIHTRTQTRPVSDRPVSFLKPIKPHSWPLRHSPIMHLSCINTAEAPAADCLSLKTCLCRKFFFR